MRLKVENWILIELILIGLIDVPDANSLVVRSTEEQSFLHWVPSQPIAFLRVSSQTKIGLDFIVNRCLWMFVIIENINFTIHGFCRYYFLILRHVPCSVNFARVVDLNVNRNSRLFLIGDSVTSDAINSFGVKDVFFIVAGVFA